MKNLLPPQNRKSPDDDKLKNRMEQILREQAQRKVLRPSRTLLRQSKNKFNDTIFEGSN